MASSVNVSGILTSFECLGSACPDTCCQGWSMQVDPERLARFAADPSLGAAVSPSPAGPVMARRASDDTCVKLEGGLCGLQRGKGAELMPDACHFFPRILRRMAGEVVVTAALSCPETARRILFGSEPLGLETAAVGRLPLALKGYDPEGLGSGDIHQVINALLTLVADPTLSPEDAMGSIGRLGRALSLSPPSLMPSSIPTLVDLVKRVKAPSEPKEGDLQRILVVFAGLVHASGSRRTRLDQVFELMAAGLGVRLDWATLNLYGAAGADLATEVLDASWAAHGGSLERPLKRWIQAEILATGFPFAGPGQDVMESAWILCLRFAIVRLALMAYVRGTGGAVDPEAVIFIVQTISRALDHLSTPALTVSLFRQMGWDHPARLRALLGETASERPASDPTRHRIVPTRDRPVADGPAREGGIHPAY